MKPCRLFDAAVQGREILLTGANRLEDPASMIRDLVAIAASRGKDAG